MYICHYALAFQAHFFNVRFWRGEKECCRVTLDRVKIDVLESTEQCKEDISELD